MSAGLFAFAQRLQADGVLYFALDGEVLTLDADTYCAMPAATVARMVARTTLAGAMDEARRQRGTL